MCVWTRVACVLPRGRKNSLVPVPRPCVSSRMEERHSSLVHSTITFTFYPCRENIYVRIYMYVAPASMLSSEPAFYSGCTRRADGERTRCDRGRRISRTFPFARGGRFFLFPRHSADFTMYADIPSGRWQVGTRLVTSRETRSRSLFARMTKALIARRGADNSRADISETNVEISPSGTFLATDIPDIRCAIRQFFIRIHPNERRVYYFRYRERSKLLPKNPDN